MVEVDAKLKCRKDLRLWQRNSRVFGDTPFGVSQSINIVNFHLENCRRGVGSQTVRSCTRKRFGGREDEQKLVTWLVVNSNRVIGIVDSWN